MKLVAQTLRRVSRRPLLFLLLCLLLGSLRGPVAVQGSVAPVSVRFTTDQMALTTGASVRLTVQLAGPPPQTVIVHRAQASTASASGLRLGGPRQR